MPEEGQGGDSGSSQRKEGLRSVSLKETSDNSDN